MAEGEYLAQPPSTCCFVGNLHKGSPRGTTEEILGVPTYIAKPEAEKATGHVVLYFPDVWGLSINSQLLVDSLADAGFLTLCMDYFRGVRISLSPSSYVV
jgi:hypothetical protein